MGASPKLREDPDVALAAIEHAGSSLMFSRRLRKDKEFCLQALRKNARCVEYIEENLRQDEDIVKAAADGCRAQRRKRCSRSQLHRRACSPHIPARSAAALSAKWPA